ncbi:hypothetical protein [Ruminococcus sp.]|uniref:hypothetical protein n=1 Tax=Ruminococcus sp. TaxID=41978 RepID=UPI003869906A
MQTAKYIMRVLGMLLIVFGVVLIVIGYFMNGNFYAQIEYYYANGRLDHTGLNLIYIGFGITAAGVILLIISIILTVKINRQFKEKTAEQEYNEFDDMVAQLAGNRSIFDVFHSEDRSRIFSFYRNKTFILKEGDQVHRGTMEPLEWANERPILWRITMDRDGKQESYEVSKVEGNILVKNDDGEQIFYRG